MVGPESQSHPVMSNSLQPHGLYILWNSPGQNTGVGSLCPSPGDLPNPGVEPRFLTLQADSLSAEPQRKSKNTGVGSDPFSRESSQPRNRIRVSCIAGRFLTELSGKWVLASYKTRMILVISSKTAQDPIMVWQALGAPGSIL